MKNYCFTCMNEIPEGNYCPHCRRENYADDVIYRLRPGTVLNGKYLVGNCIGEGGFGITYIGRDMTLDRKVAIKEYFPSGYVNRNNQINQIVTATTEQQITFFKKGLDNFIEEARRIAKLTNVSGIVDVREYFEENGTAYIIMEYLDGINLSAYLKRNGTFSPEQIFMLMLPITYSLQKMHEEGIIHRDISPDNIMYLRDGTLKLMDFGSARYFTNAQKEMSVMLKQGYAPEEQYSKNGDQGPWTDVYGLCATMYKCMTGRVPVDAIDRIRQDTLIPPSELGVPISEPMQIVLMYGLAVFKNDRCQSMQELSYMMEKALANQNIRVESPEFYNRVNQTMIANDAQMYRNEFDRAVDNRYRRDPRDGDYPPMRRNPNDYPRNGRTFDDGYTHTEYEQQRGNKTPIIIAVTIFLCIALIAATIIYLYLRYEEKLDTVAETTAPVATQTSEAADAEVIDTETAPSATEAPAPTAAAKTEPKKEATEPPKNKETEPPTNKLTFTSASASSILKPQTNSNNETKTYKPENVFNQEDSCWCEGKDGFGVNEWIKLDLPSKQRLSGLEIINGYAGSEKQYDINSKPKSVRIEFSNGSSVVKELKVFSTKERKTIQKISFNPVETTYVKITILSVDEAECEDTCITYIAPIVQ